MEKENLKVNEEIGLSPLAYEKISGDEYPPIIGAERSDVPELTLKSIIMGVILAVVFGMANAYLGLHIGMTVSASIPAAVISMGVLRGIFKKGSILENNMAQTVGSAGESLAAGVIFTIPALFLLNLEHPDVSIPTIADITLFAIIGGVLGVVFMIPLRRYLIVKEHGTLPYPEGAACAEVLVTGQKAGEGAKTVFTGLGIGAMFKLFSDGHAFHLWKETFGWGIKGLKNGVLRFQGIPALLGVGYIVGPKIAAVMLAGGMLGWLVIIPLISFFGEAVSKVIAPGTSLISTMDADTIWNFYIRPIGAGAVAAGGIISLIKALPTILSSFKAGINELIKGQALKSKKRTDKDIPVIYVIGIGIFFFFFIWYIDLIPGGALVSFLIILFSFFFVTVSSRIVGLIGSSNNPASGMTIATLLVTALILLAAGYSGAYGMAATIAIGATVCIAICIAGDTSQDLKTGFLVGATPYKQQIGEIIGVIVSALVIGYTVFILNQAFSFDPSVKGALRAPQANLIKMLISGIMTGKLSWALVIIGAFIAFVVELLGAPALPFAVGLYLPMEVSTPIMVGGLIRYFIKKCVKDEEDYKLARERGMLYSSGLIAGEAIMGILLALIVFISKRYGFNLFGMIPWTSKGQALFSGNIYALAAFLVLSFSLYKICVFRIKDT